MRATVVFVVALLVVGVLAPFAAASPVTDGQAASGSVAVQDDDATNETANETAPGAKLAGVAAVQGAEVEGEVEKRSFGLQVAAANSNASKASVVARQSQTLEAQLTALQERKAELEAARENGTISESRFRGEMAGLAARVSTLQQLTNATAETARGLPAAALADRGVNASSLDRIRTSARNLSGPDVAAIARDIAGPPNVSVGPPANGGGPPVGVPGGNNTTTGPGAGVGPGNGGNGPGDGTPGNGQNATTGQQNTTAGPGNGQGASGTVGNGNGPPGNETGVAGTGAGKAGNATNGNGPGAVGNGTGVAGNGTGVAGNGTGSGVAGTASTNTGTVVAATETATGPATRNVAPAAATGSFGAPVFAAWDDAATAVAL
ncbi:hypothetical protein [Halobacterium bonnevillei]|uniref:Uncharacterized protein n=1 Tax=Halobacterium bonnevillei TaxID=2692200 RepID=A0A6B0SV36_9EURY|nr:hypothetical protein [Halobacterium bonnevillei]MXR21389.1 hypothetical protein [Halobacterium bonnevillei]